MPLSKPKFARGEHVILYFRPDKEIIGREGIIIDSYYNEKEQIYRYIVKCSPNVGHTLWGYYERKEKQINKL